MKNQGYEALLETRLSDEEVRVIIAMLRAVGKELGSAVDAIGELEKLKANFNDNADRILEELRKDD